MKKILDIAIKLAAILIIMASFAFIFIAVVSQFQNLVEAQQTALFQTSKKFDSVCIVGRKNYSPICGSAINNDGNSYEFQFVYKYCENPYFNLRNPIKELFGDSIKLVTYSESNIVSSATMSYKVLENKEINFGVLK